MLNMLWGIMLLTGIAYGAVTGNMNAVTDAALSSAKEAVSLCITMAGIVAMWVGIMEIAKSSGLIERMTKALTPILGFLFPGIPKEHRALEFISANMIANFLGLGWAATPAGIMAMKSLQEINPNRNKSVASRDMCTFLIINISSLQLIPINIIAYRSQYGSVNPAGIVGAGIVATTVSTIAGIVFALVMAKRTIDK